MIINSTAFTSKSDNVPVKKVKLCDSVTQTMLTFPPQLTPEMEDILKQFNLFQDDQQQDYQDEEIIDESKAMMDLSTLRRKLFINQPTTPSSSAISMDESLAIHLSPPPKTPDLYVSFSMSCSYLISSKNSFIFIFSLTRKKPIVQKCIASTTPHLAVIFLVNCLQ